MAMHYIHGIELDPYQVVVRPLVTEKGAHVSLRHNAYTFQVHPLANKDQIREAVQTIWSVRVTKVRTQTKVGKPRRHKQVVGHTSNWKKAIVTLHDDDRIAFF